jgi:enoyl-CoA hydratase/carnithine racemase
MSGGAADETDTAASDTLRAVLVPVTDERCSDQPWSPDQPTASHIGYIELNRPAALNALDVRMVEDMLKAMHAWRARRDVAGVVIRSVGSPDRRPVFCAGGDVKQVVERGLRGDVEWGLRYFRSEYHLNMTLATLAACTAGGMDVVAINDGITFGGGVGISIHNKYQVCTENTIFAMPECPIGLFPDVGGSYFLSRRGAMGVYLALCGARLHGMDVKRAGFATHYVHSSHIPGVMRAIARHGDIRAALDEGERLSVEGERLSAEGSGVARFPFDIGLEEVFGYTSVETITEACRRKAEAGGEFWVEALALLRRGSPTSLRVTLELLRRGRSMPLSECLMQENRVIQRLTRDTDSDFYRGVCARLVRKSSGEPAWGPVRDAVSLLEPLEPQYELQLGTRCVSHKL